MIVHLGLLTLFLLSVNFGHVGRLLVRVETTRNPVQVLFLCKWLHYPVNVLNSIITIKV